MSKDESPTTVLDQRCDPLCPKCKKIDHIAIWLVWETKIEPSGRLHTNLRAITTSKKLADRYAYGISHDFDGDLKTDTGAEVDECLTNHLLGGEMLSNLHAEMILPEGCKFVVTKQGIRTQDNRWENRAI